MSHAANQESPRLLRHPKVYHRAHKSPPPAPIPSQMNPIQTFLPHLPKIHSNHPPTHAQAPPIAPWLIQEPKGRN